jgi:prevent-host-death family protein
MVTVNVHEAKTQLSSLLARVESRRERVLICRHGKPVADLVPHQRAKRDLRRHPRLSKISIKYDPTEPLSKADWPREAR